MEYLLQPAGPTGGWDETLALGGNSSLTEALWQWDGSWQSADTLLSARTGEAYYLFNDGGLEALTLQHPAFVEDEEGSLIAAAREERAELQLIAEMRSDDTEERQEAARLTLGHTAGDAIMHRLPPAHFAAAQLAARSGEVDAPLGRLLNPRPEAGDGVAFDIELTGVAEGEAVYVRAEDFDAFEGDEIVLVNVATGARHDLRAHGADDPVRIRIAEGHLTRASEDSDGLLPLQLLIGDQAFVDEAAERPEALTLGPVYPNPSSGEVTVEVAVPEAMDVRVELFNVLGQQVGLLHSGELPAGVHQMRWDGRTAERRRGGLRRVPRPAHRARWHAAHRTPDPGAVMPALLFTYCFANLPSNIMYRLKPGLTLFAALSHLRPVACLRRRRSDLRAPASRGARAAHQCGRVQPGLRRG